MADNIPPELVEKMKEARSQTIAQIAEVAGSAMDQMRAQLKAIYNTASSESQIIRVGMAATAVFATERLGQGIMTAVLKRFEMFAELVVSQEQYRKEHAALVARLDALEGKQPCP